MLIIQHTTYSKYHSYSKAWWWQHHGVGMFPAAGTGRLVRIEGIINAAMYRNILDESLTSDWGDGSSLSRTMIPNTEPSCQWLNCFRTTLWMSLSGPARAQTGIWLNISGETWKWEVLQREMSETAQRRVARKGCEYLCSCSFSVLRVFLPKFAKNVHWLFLFFSEYWQKWIEYILE